MAKTIQYREQRITQSHKYHILPDFSDQHDETYRGNSKILRHILTLKIILVYHGLVHRITKTHTDAHRINIMD